jgi:hypothetical protein
MFHDFAGDHVSFVFILIITTTTTTIYYHIQQGYLQLYTLIQTMFQGYVMLQVFRGCNMCNAVSDERRFVLLH